MTAAQSDLAGLSRYIFGTPVWYRSTAFALVIAALAGMVIFGSYSIRERGVVFVGTPTIIAGILTPLIDRAFGDRLTLRQSSFLALVCEFIVVAFVTVGALVSFSSGFGQRFLLDTLITALAVIFAVRVHDS